MSGLKLNNIGYDFQYGNLNARTTNGPFATLGYLAVHISSDVFEIAFFEVLGLRYYVACI